MWVSDSHGGSPDGPGSAPRSGPVISLVLRTWFEPGVPVRFRTRGVEVVSGRGERPVFTASTVDEACQAVRDWLEAAGAAAAVTPR